MDQRIETLQRALERVKTPELMARPDYREVREYLGRELAESKK